MFKNSISEPLYNHFLLLHTAVRILGYEELFRGEGVIQYCEGLMKLYVKDAMTLYGEHFISYNVHNLIHVPDDVSYMNSPLYEFSCYSFENNLQTIKNWLYPTAIC